MDPDVTGNPVDRTLLLFLLALAVYVLSTRWTQVARIFRHNRWLVALFAYLALSIVWSNFPDFTLRRTIRSMGTLAMVLVVLTEKFPVEAVRALLRRLYMVHIPLSIAAIKYFRNIGVAYTWDGSEEMWVGARCSGSDSVPFGWDSTTSKLVLNTAGCA